MIKTSKDHAERSLRQKLDNLISIVDLVSYWVNRESIFILRKLTLDAASSGPVFRMRVHIWTQLNWAQVINMAEKLNLIPLVIWKDFIESFQYFFRSQRICKVGIDTSNLFYWFLVHCFRSCWFNSFFFSFFSIPYDGLRLYVKFWRIKTELVLP